MAIGIRAWAEVDADVPGTVELTGPWHLHCAGLSRRRPATYIRRPSQPSTSEKDGRPRPASTALPGNTRLRSRYLPKTSAFRRVSPPVIHRPTLSPIRTIRRDPAPW